VTCRPAWNFDAIGYVAAALSSGLGGGSAESPENDHSFEAE
jgi:hypothetical protein